MAVVEINWKPDRAALRSFAVVWMVGFTVIGTVVGFTLTWSLGLWFVAAALAVGVLGFLVPEAVRLVYLVWMGLAFPIGWVMTHLVLVVVYFGVFTPMAMAFRLVGRDALDRKGGPRTGSYWSEYHPRPDGKTYFRQF